MTKEQNIEFILSRLKVKNPDFIDLHSDPNSRIAYIELIKLGLIEDIGNRAQFTGEGIKFSNSNLLYSEWLNRDQSTNVHIGDKYDFPINQSNNSNSSLNINANKTVNDKYDNKTTQKGILKWVGAVIAAIGIIWEILHAYHINIHF